MLEYHKMTEEEKYCIARWKYPGEYAIYNSLSYEEQKTRGLGFANPENHLYSFYDGKDLVGFINLNGEDPEVFFGIGANPDCCGIARSSTMNLGILLITLTIMCIVAIPQADPQIPPLSPNDTIWKGFFRSMTTADELPLLFLLLDFSEKKTYRSIVPVWVGKFLLGSYLSVLGMAVLGSRMAKASHPFFAIVSVSQPDISFSVNMRQPVTVS